MTSKLLRIVAAVVALGAANPGTAALVPVSEVSDVNAAVYRDSEDPNIFYILPIAYTIASGTGKARRIGVQYFEDAKGKGSYSASFTLTVSSSLGAQGTSPYLERIKERFKVTNPRLAAPPRVTTRLSVYRASTSLTQLFASSWISIPSSGSQAFSFSIPEIGKAELAQVLSADRQRLLLLAEHRIEGVIDGVASARLQGRAVAEVANNRQYLSTGTDFEAFVDEVISTAVEASARDRQYIREGVRDLLRRQLGAPSLVLVDSKSRYGWALRQTPISSFSDVTIRIPLGSARTETIGAPVELGNVCESDPGAILGIDTGAVGCGSLR